MRSLEEFANHCDPSWIQQLKPDPEQEKHAPNKSSRKVCVVSVGARGCRLGRQNLSMQEMNVMHLHGWVKIFVNTHMPSNESLFLLRAQAACTRACVRTCVVTNTTPASTTLHLLGDRCGQDITCWSTPRPCPARSF